MEIILVKHETMKHHHYYYMLGNIFIVPCLYEMLCGISC